MLGGLQPPYEERPNASVTLQTTHAKAPVPCVPLHTLAGSLQAADARLQTPCVTGQTTLVTVQTGVAGQQTSFGNGLLTAPRILLKQALGTIYRQGDE